LLHRQTHRMCLSPISAVVQRIDGYACAGPDPTFLLEPADSAFIAGWICFRCQLSAPAEQFDLTLIAETSSSWPESVSRRLPSRDAIGTGCLLLLPPGTRMLRLSLPTCPQQFRIWDVTIQQRSKLQVVISILQRRCRRPSDLLHLAQRASSILWRRGIAGLRQTLYSATGAAEDYATWVRLYDSFPSRDRVILTDRMARLEWRPRLLLLLLADAGDQRALEQTLDSLANQTYDSWKLLILLRTADPDLASLLADASKRNPSIVISRHQSITDCGAQEKAVLAESDAIGFLDTGDQLPPHALHSIAEELIAHPRAILVYSDEDQITADGQRYDPWFKSDWNPDLMLNADAIGRIAFFRSAFVNSMVGDQSIFQPDLERNLGQRIASTMDMGAVRHRPQVLYHRADSLFNTDNPNLGNPDRQQAKAAQIQQNGVDPRSPQQAIGRHGEVIFPLPNPPPHISIIIPTKDAVGLLRACVQSVLTRSNYPSFDLTIVNNRSKSKATYRYFAEITKDARVSLLDYDAPYNFAAINNLAASRVHGDLLVFLNNDTEVISANWLGEMARHALRAQIGPVGAMLYYRNNSVQHAGVLLGRNVPADHAHKGLPRGQSGYRGLAAKIQNFSAVTAACMMIRREVFELAGGFDDQHFAVAYNDVDLCLRLWELGYRTLWTPHAELYHYESATLKMPYRRARRKRTVEEVNTFIARWQECIRHDPFHNPNLSRFSNGMTLAFPPACPHRWRVMEPRSEHLGESARHNLHLEGENDVRDASQYHSGPARRSD
jgi:GT2 family glycosyltransferase